MKWKSKQLKRIVSYESRSRVGRKWKPSDPSDSDSVELPIPIATRFLNLHYKVRFLTRFRLRLRFRLPRSWESALILQTYHPTMFFFSVGCILGTYVRFQLANAVRLRSEIQYAR